MHKHIMLPATKYELYMVRYYQELQRQGKSKSKHTKAYKTDKKARNCYTG